MNMRDSTNYQPLRVNGPFGRFNEAAESNSFAFAGGDYRWSDSLSTSYFYAQLDEIYQQHYFGLTHFQPLGGGKLPGIAVGDVGKVVLGIFAKGTSMVGQTVGIAGETLSGPELEAAFAKHLGRPVAF